jgi:hypothetical protein
VATVDLLTLAEAKTHLEIDHDGDDTLLAALITAASRAINRRYDRELTPKTTATRRFAVRSHLVDLAPHDLRTATTVTFSPDIAPQPLEESDGYVLDHAGRSALTATALLLHLDRYLNLRTSYYDKFGYELVEIAGAWGAWTTAEVHEDVKRACAVTVGSWMDRAIEAYANEGEDPRSLRPSRFVSWAIPKNAHDLLVGAGVPRSTSV